MATATSMETSTNRTTAIKINSTLCPTNFIVARITTFLIRSTLITTTSSRPRKWSTTHTKESMSKMQMRNNCRNIWSRKSIKRSENLFHRCVSIELPEKAPVVLRTRSLRTCLPSRRLLQKASEAMSRHSTNSSKNRLRSTRNPGWLVNKKCLQMKTIQSKHRSAWQLHPLDSNPPHSKTSSMKQSAIRMTKMLSWTRACRQRLFSTIQRWTMGQITPNAWQSPPRGNK